MSTPVARRYAQALYQEAVQQGQAERTDADVDLLLSTFGSSRELAVLLESPIVPRPRKEAVLERLFGERVGPLMHRFMRLLVSKEREDLLPIMARAYTHARDIREGIVEARVRTAQPFGPDEETALTHAIEAREGKRVRLYVEVDPSLIGGLVVRVGDVVYDRSVRHQLDLLREGFARKTALHVN